MQFPGRLELVRRSPAVVLDAAHNPHGARAAAAAVTEAFGFTPLVGVVAVMADKDAEGLLRVFEEIMQQVVITQVASTTRGMPAEQLGELAESIFGADRVHVAPRLGRRAGEGGHPGRVRRHRCSRRAGHRLGGAGRGGSDAAGRARAGASARDSSDDPDDDWDADYAEGRGSDEDSDGDDRGDRCADHLSPENPMRNVLLAVLIFEVIVFGLAVPVMIFVSACPARLAALAGGGAALLALVVGRPAAPPVGYYVGWVTQPVGIALGLLTYGMFVVGIMFAELCGC